MQRPQTHNFSGYFICHRQGGKARDLQVTPEPFLPARVAWNPGLVLHACEEVALAALHALNFHLIMLLRANILANLGTPLKACGSHPTAEFPDSPLRLTRVIMFCQA